MNIWRGFVSSLLISFISSSACAQAISNVTIFADDGTSLAVSKIARAYSNSTHVAVTTSFLGKEEQSKQILEGSAADILITSDLKWIEELQTQGLVDVYSKIEFARGELALVGGSNSTISLIPEPNFSVAPLIEAMHQEPALLLGNPEYVPVGKHAKDVLRQLNVSDALEPYILYLKDSEEILEMVRRGEAFTITYQANILMDPKLRMVALFPQDAHQPIPYYAVVIAGDHMEEARKMMKFFTSPEAHALMQSSGLVASVPVAQNQAR